MRAHWLPTWRYRKLIDKLKGSPQELGRLAVTGLMLGLCIYLLVLIAMQFFASADNGTRDIDRVQAAKAIYWNWFRGDVAAVTTADIDSPTEKHGELADADIKGILLGVMIAPDDAFATLKFNGKPEAVYRKGDELSSGYQLVDIEPYRIVVRKNGANRQVLMKKPDNIIETEQVDRPIAAPEPQEGFALANMFGAVPVSAGGGAGLKLNNLSSEISSMADIRDGDIVLQVNGMSVQELMANPAQWLSYSTNTSLPVTIMRQGQQETIYVNAASLSAKMLPNLGLTR